MREVAQDVLTDFDFSPTNSQIFVTASGNGKIVIQDQNNQKKAEVMAHTAEIPSVEWMFSSEILTGSWDGSLKMVRNIL